MWGKKLSKDVKHQRLTITCNKLNKNALYASFLVKKDSMKYNSRKEFFESHNFP